MRSWPMRILYALLALVILFAWAWSIAAAFGADVERLPGHDLSVPVARCVACHTAPAATDGAPRLRHPITPSCGFCHRQGLPEGLPAVR